MAKSGTLLSLVKNRDTQALKQVLSRSLFPAWAFRTNRMLLARLREVRKLPRALPRITIRWGGAEDLDALQAVRPRKNGYGCHLDSGKLLVVGELDGRVASFNWFELGEVHSSGPNGYEFVLGPSAAWAFGFEVAPDARMSGIFHKHWFEAMGLLLERGLSTVYGSIQGDNPRSVNSHRRLGFELLYDFELMRVVGIERFRVQPLYREGLPTIRGFGMWRGRDESDALDQDPSTR